MSLKAKLEAVIYAAEEPVTLVQLAALFADEALALKAEREGAQAAAADAAAQPASETLPLLDEGFAYLGLEQTPAFYTAPAGEAGGLPVVAPAEVPLPPPASGETIAHEAARVESEPAPPPAEGAASDALAQASEPAVPAEADTAADSEAETRKAARAREREVRSIVEGLIEELRASYASDDRGIEIREIAGGYRMATKPEYHDGVRAFIRSLKPPLKLSLQALETLAVVAYKQPVTAPEVSEIRGVESAGTLGSLLGRKLIATAGRKQVIGRPILYKTTREFLLRFGLKDVSELPSMDEFEKMAAIELEEQPAEGSEAPAENGEEEAGELALEESAEPAGEKAGGEPAQDADPSAETRTGQPVASEAPCCASDSTESKESEGSHDGQ